VHFSLSVNVQVMWECETLREQQKT